MTTRVAPLVGKQRLSVELATHRINVWEGAVRSSKTVCSLLWWLRFVRSGPPGNLAMVGKTERTLKRNVVDPLLDMLGPKRCKPNWGDGELLLLGRRVYLAGANNEAAVGKIQGLTLAGAYVDEATLLPEAFWSMLLSRLSVEGAKVAATMNPDTPLHWMMRDYLERASVWLRHDGVVEQHDGGLDLARFSFRLADNPALPASYVEALSNEFTGLWRRRFIEGLWVVAGGAIYDQFDPTPGGPHVVSTLPTIDEWVVAVDYGTTNPFVALLIGLGADDRVYVAREWRWDSRARGRQLTDGEYSTRIREWLDDVGLPGASRPVHVIVDPSAASFIAQLWRDGWEGVRGADNAVQDGIRSVATLLARDRLKIHESCSGLLEEKAGYVWDPDAAKRGIERPVKVADHGCLVAGTLVTTARGAAPIERVRRGDQVWTRDGWRLVRASGMTQRSAEVLTVRISDGRTITGTGDHPVWVEGQGWTRLDALRYGDRLRTWVRSRSSSSEASGSAATPTRRDGLTAPTSRQARRIVSAVWGAFTRRSGRWRTARSLPATTSTTSTSTRSTTTWPTSPASPTPTMPRFIGSAPSRWGEPTRRARRPVQLQPNGIAAPRAERGTGSTAAEPGKAASRSPAPASSAASDSSRSTPAASAPTPASRSGVGLRALTMSTAPASAALAPSRPTGTTSAASAAGHVLSVTAAGRADVFNLTIDGTPEYLANGVLVHNCDAERYGIMGTRPWWRHWVSVMPVESAA